MLPMNSVFKLTPSTPPCAGDVQVTHRLVDNTFDAGTGGGALPGAGNLFNCIAAKDQNGKQAVFFVDDNLNNVQTLHY